MIKNERQYRVTKAQAVAFKRALAELDKGGEGLPADPRLVKAQKDALRSQLADLTAELDEYEALVSGKRTVIEVESIEGLPHALIQARIASGLTQKDLADRLNVKEQQVQRYEASDYASASLRRLIEVCRALDLKVRQDILLPRSQMSFRALLSRLGKLGLNEDLILRRLAPPMVLARMESAGADNDADVLRVAARVGRVFGWTAGQILGDSPLRPSTADAGAGRFKVPLRMDERRLDAYVAYARFLATVLLDATPHLVPHAIPDQADAVRRSVLSPDGALTFEHTLRYVWDLGVPVLPLRDPGAFHGACWRVAGRNVIVLKQKTPSAARWLFDLLHELWHAAQRPEQRELAVIEPDEDVQAGRGSPEEEAANRFAADVLLGGRSAELAALCMREARGGLKNLKTAVKRVALAEKVPVDALANYMAFCLSHEGENWWGAAANLQQRGGAPWGTARDVLLQRVNLGRLSEVDRELLALPLSED